jgi:hypothetical protein
MKKYNSGIIPLIISLMIVFNLGAHTEYTKYNNELFNYSIIVPYSWEFSDVDLDGKHVMTATKNKFTEIKVRAFKNADPNIEKTERENIWNLWEIDPGLNRIITSGDITIKKNITGKLFLFEYRSKRNKILQRTLITKNGNITYVIECKSTLKNFYRYEKSFNIAMSSFKYLSGGGNKDASDNDSIIEKKESLGSEDVMKDKSDAGKNSDMD